MMIFILRALALLTCEIVIKLVESRVEGTK